MTYRKFFAAFNRSKQKGNPLTRQELVLEFTCGRTGSLNELAPEELEELTRAINKMNGDNYQKRSIDNPKADRMRKAIIAIFHKMNRPPAAAIAWAEKQGVQGKKKRFNDYTNQELYSLIMIAENILGDYELALRKKMQNL